MFGWTKREKNEKSQNSARAELSKLSLKDKGAKLSRLRKRYPNRVVSSMWDFEDRLFDYEMIFLYILLSDDLAVEEADQIDNPIEVEPPTVAEIASEEPVEVVVEAEVTEASVATTESFDSSTPVEHTSESTPETTSFDSGSDSYGGGGGGGDSFDSGDSGGGDCGGD